MDLPLADVELRARFDAALESADPDGPQQIEVGIPVRASLELAADVYLPAADRLPAPAIVFGTPYDKSQPALNAIEAQIYQEAGYVAVVYDVRGRGKSEGEWRAFTHDAQDGHDVVEWVAAQPWCTGAVGTSGLSYSGWVNWATASERPPHLQAMISTSAAGRWMEEVPATNGCFQLYFAYWVAAVRRRLLGLGHLDLDALVRTLPVSRIGRQIDPSGRTWDDLMEHDTLDDHWRARRFDGRYNRIDVPCLHVTGWHDLEDLLGAFHHYERMVEESPAAAEQWLIVGPWSHIMCRWPGSAYGGVQYDRQAAIDMHRVHLRFFDRFLREERNGIDEEPRVRLYDPGADRWATPRAWAADTQPRVLHLSGETLAEGPGPDAVRTYHYDPLDPPTAKFDLHAPLWEPDLDMSAIEARDDVLVFTSAPLDAPLTIHGWPQIVLHAETDGEDTDWHVKLTDCPPDGRSLRVASGCVRASHHTSLSEPEPIEPGAVVEYAIGLSPAYHTFQPGHRICVTVTSSDFPWFARNLNRFGPIAGQADPRVARNTIYLGASWPSHIVLPVAVPVGRAGA
jgi:hypothetical protein